MKRKDPPKQKRNAKCACGSGLKYKKCCWITDLNKAFQDRQEFKERLRAQGESCLKQLQQEKAEREARRHNEMPLKPAMRFSNMALIAAVMAGACDMHRGANR